MPSPFDRLREELDFSVRNITNNAFRLTQDDPDAAGKWITGAIIPYSAERDAATGSPPGTSFTQYLDQTIGGGAGAPAPLPQPAQPARLLPQPAQPRPVPFGVPSSGPPSTNIIGQTIGRGIGPPARALGRGTGAAGRYLGEGMPQQAYGAGGGGAEFI